MPCRKSNRPLPATLRSALLLVTLCALLAPAGASAGDRPSVFVPQSLYAAARAEPDRGFDVIVQGAPNVGMVARAVTAALTAVPAKEKDKAKEPRRFTSVDAVNVQLTGQQLVYLAGARDVLSITPNTRLDVAGFLNKQQWPYVTGVPKLWPLTTSTGLLGAPVPPTPGIAIVDSGVDAAREDFGGRVTNVDLYTGTAQNAAGDGRGHGTFVASIAAGQAAGYTGMAPSAPIVSLDVVDDSGHGSVSDLLAACDWLLANKDRYGIRVANFSIYAASPATIRFDPLNRAVEKLWLSGLVVVAAAGNYGSAAGPSGIPYAPANDPFVITVGAADISGSVSTNDDFTAPWSAWGYTPDGFAKPDLSAPGRYMVGAVPATATMTTEHPERVVAPGYMQISGTSFSAPVVSGAAAELLALHPSWTPDQVKGALMLRAKPMGAAVPRSSGVGEVYLPESNTLTLPPNPNLSLRKFVVADPAGGTMFDAEAWSAAAAADPLWDAGTWEPGTWEPGTWEPSATWDTASWISGTWEPGTWEPGTWEPGTWEPSSWVSGTWEPGTWEPGTWEPSTWLNGLDAAAADFNSAGGYWISDLERQQVLAELGVTG